MKNWSVHIVCDMCKKVHGDFQSSKFCIPLTVCTANMKQALFLPMSEKEWHILTLIIVEKGNRST